MSFSADDHRHMQRALELAARGLGYVEPNPMVGCVIVRDGQVVGEGWHRRFGDLHAEAEALKVAGEQARGATLYVTLEPCCHHGKQPPCADAVITAGVARVVAAMRDPFPAVAGGGFERLRQAGVQVEVGLCEDESRQLLAPFTKLVTTGRPWVIAKWAMTLDGKLATGAGDSRWISCPASREVAHRLRARVDAILVGSRTARLDDPLLTTRLPDGEAPPRVAARIVLDSTASLSLTSKLVATIHQAPVMVVAGPQATPAAIAQLTSAGCEVLQLDAPSHEQRIEQLLAELGKRRMTNLLVEGGSSVLGAFFDIGQVDEVHAFIAPIVAGGATAPSPVGGSGVSKMAEALRLQGLQQRIIEGDLYCSGRIARKHCS